MICRASVPHKNSAVVVATPSAVFDASMEEHCNLTTGDGSLDFSGKPVLKSKTGNWRACIFILDPSFRIGCLGKVNMAYENDWDSMICFYGFVAKCMRS